MPGFAQFLGKIISSFFVNFVAKNRRWILVSQIPPPAFASGGQNPFYKKGSL